MPRIRSVKPEFFKHEGLYEAEITSGLPLRVGFAGLWTACCRDGRFKWRPRALKLDCLPYDDLDFSRVLDALWTRGFIEKYEQNGELFGFIPSWAEHQVVNNRETESNLPEPIESSILTREPRVDDATGTPLGKDQGERKGKERKGKEIRVGNANSETTFKKWIETIPDDQDAIPKDHSVFTYAEKVGMPVEFVDLAWAYFGKYYGTGNGKDKKYKDWPAHFRTSVQDGYGKLWAIGQQDNTYYLTTVGKQLQLEVGGEA